MNKESKLTKYTLVAMAILLTAYFATDARAEAPRDDVVVLSSICSATHGVLAVKSDSEVLGDLFAEEGRWWREFLVAYTENEEASHESIRIALKEIQEQYNSGELTWDKLVDYGQICASLKTEIQELTEKASQE